MSIRRVHREYNTDMADPPFNIANVSTAQEAPPSGSDDVVPWEVALIARIPLPPLLSGTLVAFLMLACFAGYQSLVGNPIWSETSEGL